MAMKGTAALYLPGTGHDKRRFPIRNRTFPFTTNCNIRKLLFPGVGYQSHNSHSADIRGCEAVSVVRNELS